MKKTIVVNNKKYSLYLEAGELLKDSLRKIGMTSVKCGCTSSNCGLCTVWLNKEPVLSCSILTVRLKEDDEITTLEGLQEEAKRFGYYLGQEGAEQCGYCSPGFIMSVLSLVHRKERSEEEINTYLQGNLCRCTGYQGQYRAIKKFLDEVSHD